MRMLLDIGEARGQNEDEAIKGFLDDFRRWHWPEGQPLPEIWCDPLSLSPYGPQRAVAHARCVVADGQSFRVVGKFHRGISESKS